jgi:hypothetical protein
VLLVGSKTGVGAGAATVRLAIKSARGMTERRIFDYAFRTLEKLGLEADL